MYGLSTHSSQADHLKTHFHVQDVQCHQPMQFTIPYSHFAIMYVDNRGEIQVEASPSVMGYEKAVFTEEIQERFLKLANGEWQPSLHNVYSGEKATELK
jgi:hypothetical protein